VDVGFNYTTNVQGAIVNGKPTGAGNQVAVMDGATGLQGSRWGFKGSEDLGGGLKAVFQLENGFSINNGTTGQGGTEFGRQAYVGLANNRGALTLGRQYDPLVDLVGPFAAAAQWAGYIAAHPDDLDNLLNTRRVNNSVKASAIVLPGLRIEALYGAGGVAGAAGRNQVWSIGAGYAVGGLQLGTAYVMARNPNLSYFGTNANAAGVTGNNLGSLGSATAPEQNPVYAGFSSASSLAILGTGAAYTFGSAMFGATYTNTRFINLGDVATSGPNPLGYAGVAAFNNVEGNFKYQLTPTLLAGVAFDYTRASPVGGHAGATYWQGAGGVDYSLSKRTDVYGLVVYQQASGIDSTGHAAVASITGLTASSNSRQTALRIGLRHRF
jgi:predicted porin